MMSPARLHVCIMGRACRWAGGIELTPIRGGVGRLAARTDLDGLLRDALVGRRHHGDEEVDEEDVADEEVEAKEEQRDVRVDRAVLEAVRVEAVRLAVQA